MSAGDGQPAPPMAPALLVGLCILGAVVAVIVTAVLYKLCRRATMDVEQEAAMDREWNLNQRSVEQSQYMEEVRLRNKMAAWERARAGRVRDREENEFERRFKVID